MTAESKQALVAGLVASHGEQLRRFLLSRVRSADDIQDIVQEAFLRLLRVPDHEAMRSPEAYLFTIARHVAQQHALRRQSNTILSVQFQHMLTSLDATPNDPALEVSAQQSLQELEHALQRLSPKARATFLWHRRDGLTLEEIGNRLGLSRAMAKKHLAKALLEFRKQFVETE